MWNNIKRSNVCNYNPEKTVEGTEKSFEELIDEFFFNLMKTLNLHIKGAQQTLRRINIKEAIP